MGEISCAMWEWCDAGLVLVVQCDGNTLVVLWYLVLIVTDLCWIALCSGGVLPVCCFVVIT